jgi:lipoate-protein ligase A
MKLLDLTLPTPAENLACDEALLDWCEEESGEEILRFWEPREYFVVVGYANKISTEANAAACAENQIPILRRCSGGGTVLQGPGCLNYSLILKISDHEPLQSISSTNRFIMETNCKAIETLLPSNSELKTQNSKLSIQGHTDLALCTPHSALRTPQKFSGNSQRRKKHFLLFHGTFLLRFDISLIEKFLPMPSKQPDYRHERTHSDFLTNLELPADSVKRALRKVWHTDEPLKNLPRDQIQLLSRDKYVTNEWNFKF